MQTQPSDPTYYARLQFADAAGCVDWLGSLPLERTADAHEMVAAQVALASRAELPPLERLRILELLYQAASFLQEELATRYIGRALPLSIVEYSLWRTVLELWQVLHCGYLLALRRAVKGEAALASHQPLLALRCIELTAAAIREHHRVYREVPGALWRQLHEAYAFAERHNLAAAPATDPLLRSAGTRTPTAAYARILLAHGANPYTLSPRQMDVMYRWSGLWAHLVGVGAVPVAPALTTVLAVDLASDGPAAGARRIEAGTTIRYLALEALGHALRRLLTALRQGQDPAALELGEDLHQPGCERLLTLLYIQWCGSGISPLTGVRERGEDARAAVGFEGVCRQLALESDAFRSAGAAVRTASGPFTEQWYVAASGAPGFIAVARGPECDERLQHHQLVAIRRRSTSHFQLAVAQWLKLEHDGDLSIGLRVLPGIPLATRVDAGEAPGPAAATAILLPAAPEMRTPATLVLAPQTFAPGRELDLGCGTPRRVKLTRLLERGADFERAVFEPIS